MHIANVERWLKEPDIEALDSRGLLDGLARRLTDAGLPLVRVGAWIPTQHPEIWGTQLVWTREQGASVLLRPHETTTTATYRGSPGEAVQVAKQPIRCRLDVPREQLDYPVLAEIAALGATDYVILPVGLPKWVAFAIDRPQGFSDEEIRALESLCSVLAVHFQLAAARHATRSLLEVYLGPNAAGHVMSGAFRRGTGTTIRAAIWFCDMRGFTSLSDRLPPSEVVRLLDEYFECVAGAIEDQGGEILKLIGDAALAIFPIHDQSSDSCGRALAAAEGALERLAQWRAVAGRPDLRLGIALHVGEVMYGNIGGRHRLDFTVIGAAVNEVCRVESLCKSLGSPLLMTAPFVRSLDRRDVLSLGEHVLKGVSNPQEILTLRSLAPA